MNFIKTMAELIVEAKEAKSKSERNKILDCAMHNLNCFYSGRIVVEVISIADEYCVLDTSIQIGIKRRVLELGIKQVRKGDSINIEGIALPVSRT